MVVVLVDDTHAPEQPVVLVVVAGHLTMVFRALLALQEERDPRSRERRTKTGAEGIATGGAHPSRSPC